MNGFIPYKEFGVDLPDKTYYADKSEFIQPNIGGDMKRIIGLFILIFSLCPSLPVLAEAADALPDGVVSLSPNGMTWKDAQAYCASEGGHLPLFGGKKRLAAPDGNAPNSPVELFDFDGAKWPSGLPFGHYWLGTERNTRPGHAWKIFDANGNVVVTFASKNDTLRAACVSSKDAPKKESLEKITIVGKIEMPGTDGTGSIASEDGTMLLWNDQQGFNIYTTCKVGQTCKITATASDSRIVTLLSVELMPD